MRYLLALSLLLSVPAFADQATSKEGYWNSQGYYSKNNTQAAPVPPNIPFKNYVEAIGKNPTGQLPGEDKTQTEIRIKRVPVDDTTIPGIRNDVLSNATYKAGGAVDVSEKLNEAARIARHGQAGTTAEAATMLISGIGFLLNLDPGQRLVGANLVAEAGRMYAIAGQFRKAGDFNARGRRMLTRDYTQACAQNSKNCTPQSPYFGTAKLTKLENENDHVADFGDDATSALAMLFEANDAGPGVMQELMAGEIKDGEQVLRALNLVEGAELKVPDGLRELVAVKSGEDLKDRDLAESRGLNDKGLREGKDLNSKDLNGGELRTLAAVRGGSLRLSAAERAEKLGAKDKKDDQDKAALRGKGLLKRASALRRGKPGAGDDDDLELGNADSKKRKKTLEARLRELRDEKEQLIAEGASAATTLYEQGVQPARAGVHIFQLAHRHYRAFRKWRREYTQILVSRGLEGQTPSGKIKTAQVETSELE